MTGNVLLPNDGEKWHVILHGSIDGDSVQIECIHYGSGPILLAAESPDDTSIRGPMGGNAAPPSPVSFTYTGPPAGFETDEVQITLAGQQLQLNAHWADAASTDQVDVSVRVDALVSSGVGIVPDPGPLPAGQLASVAVTGEATVQVVGPAASTATVQVAGEVLREMPTAM